MCNQWKLWGLQITTPTPLHPWPICWSQHVPGLNGNEGGRMGGLTFTFSGHFIWERVIKFITNILFSLSGNMEIKHLNRLTLTGFCRRFHLRCLERQKYRWSKEFRLLKIIISPILYTVCPLHIYINGFHTDLSLYNNLIFWCICLLWMLLFISIIFGKTQWNWLNNRIVWSHSRPIFYESFPCNWFTNVTFFMMNSPSTICPQDVREALDIGKCLI